MLIDTNGILSLALSLVATFSDRTAVPSGDVPRASSDLTYFQIAPKKNDVLVHLVNRNGAEFWVDYGAVTGYSSPRSFFSHQNPSDIDQFTGTSGFGTNEIIKACEEFVLPLIKSGAPLSDGNPTIKSAGQYRGAAIPFVQVSWPKKGQGSRVAAVVEVDCRTGTVVRMHVFGAGFHDPAVMARMFSMVQAPQSTSKDNAPPPSRSTPPTPEAAADLLAKGAAFCNKYHLTPCRSETLADVDWKRSFVYSAGSIDREGAATPLKPETCVTLRDGTELEAAEGIVYEYTCADALLKDDGQPLSSEQLASLGRKPKYGWQELAAALEKHVCTIMPEIKPLFDKFSPKLKSPPARADNTPLARARILWMPETAERYGDPSLDLLRCLMVAEFDLQTGEVKRLGFQQPELADPVLAKALRGQAF